MTIKYSRSGENTKSVETDNALTLQALIEDEFGQSFDPALTYTLNDNPISGDTHLRDGDHIYAVTKVSGGTSQ